MTIYGVSATAWMRSHTPGTAGLLNSFAGVILNLCGPEMKVMEKLCENESATIGSIDRRGENPEIPAVHRLALPPEER
jgi:hypothetical protein